MTYSTIWSRHSGTVLWIWRVDFESGSFDLGFISPFGLFEWNRMPFGLKNAPQIYQRMIDNALYGFTRIPKSEDHGSTLDVFEDREPVDPGKPSVLGRRSYIDDIMIPANNWDQLCDRVEGLLEACDKWNLSVSVIRSFWGMPKVEYPGHRVSHNGLEANPKDLSALTDLTFPGSLSVMQSFLGSLNYYSRIIEDYAIYASVLYELREIDFTAMMKDTVQVQIKRVLEVENVDQGVHEDQTIDHKKLWIWGRKISLKSIRVGSMAIGLSVCLNSRSPPLRSCDILIQKSELRAWSMLEYDKVYYPVMFASRTLKSNELNYGIVKKEVLALLRILDINYNTLVGRPINIHNPTGTFRLVGRPIVAVDSRDHQMCKGKDEILGALTASITPRSEVDKVLILIAPKKEPRHKIQVPIPTVGDNEDLFGVSFDGSARVKRGGGAYSANLWKLPEWRVLKARSSNAEDLTVNEAEYHGLLLCLGLLEGLDPQRLGICGDSNRVIRQVRGEIDCKATGLTLLRQRALDRLRTWPDHELLHAKQDWNGSADNLASAALRRQCGIEVESEQEIHLEPAGRDLGGELRRQCGIEVESEQEIQDLVTLSRVDEIWVVEVEDETGQISADEESWISGLKKYQVGEIRDLTHEDAKVFGSIAMYYEIDQSDLLFYCPTTKEAVADRDKLMRLVGPETLQQDILHHYHTSLQGGHEGIGRTYDRIRDHFHWRELYKSVQRYVGSALTAKQANDDLG
ncbi:reverse transcriptase [Phytophthora megakarya]|uniref:Reverse transcriptase n=1 Tax=Phytophthora megakarya TaxID=4795 RepID=A0A225W1V0_9STRA|nr:reverse transcriptase [Phytophthora megakarya]